MTESFVQVSGWAHVQPPLAWRFPVAELAQTPSLCAQGFQHDKFVV